VGTASADGAAGRAESAGQQAGAGQPIAPESDAMRKALELLREALSGPSSTRYQAESTSGRGTTYDLEVDAAGGVHCSCAGFEYRGSCNHARRLKTALANGDALPAGIRAVGEES
jgi:hypothetical protein